MRLHGKLAVDHYVGGPLAWILNIGAQLLAPFLRRDHSLKKQPRTVLFLKFIGMGSIVRASFLIPAIKERFPDAKVAFAVFPGCAPLAKLYDQVDEVLVVRDSMLHIIPDTIKLLVWCWKSKVDLVIDLEVYAKYSALISALSLARDRAGFAGATSRFRRGLYTHLVFWNPLRFVDHAYQQLGAAIGLNPAVSPKIKIPALAISEARSFLESLGLKENQRLIGINPNASELRSERRWPLEHFAALIKILRERLPDALIVIVGAPSEHAYCQELCDLLCEGGQDLKIFNIAGRISFAGFLEVLSRCAVFVTNDSGPLHCARALDVKTVSLWGPTHPVNYSPRGPGHISIYRPIYCSPCTHASDVPPCGGDNQCLKLISPERAAGAVFRLLGEKSALGSLPHYRDEHVEAHGVYGYWQRESVPLVNPGRQRSTTARIEKDKE